MGYKARLGFSLVELSIVLVILGLLVGGVLAGQSLIRSSQMRSITEDINRFRAATASFTDKYGFMPADFPKATMVWGELHADTATCQGTNTTTAGTATCNGDGDGIVSKISNWNYTELMTYWQHLGNAGLLDGQYFKLGGATAGGCNGRPKGSPKSKIGDNASYTFQYSWSDWVEAGWGVSALLTPINTNIYVVGTMPPGWASCHSVPSLGGVVSPDEAFLTDTKFDDGKPATGMILNYKNTSALAPGCTTTNVAATSVYALGTNAVCPIIFKYKHKR